MKSMISPEMDTHPRRTLQFEIELQVWGATGHVPVLSPNDNIPQAVWGCWHWPMGLIKDPQSFQFIRSQFLEGATPVTLRNLSKSSSYPSASSIASSAASSALSPSPTITTTSSSPTCSSTSSASCSPSTAASSYASCSDISVD